MFHIHIDEIIDNYSKDGNVVITNCPQCSSPPAMLIYNSKYKRKSIKIPDGKDIRIRFLDGCIAVVGIDLRGWFRVEIENEGSGIYQLHRCYPKYDYFDYTDILCIKSDIKSHTIINKKITLVQKEDLWIE